MKKNLSLLLIILITLACASSYSASVVIKSQPPEGKYTAADVDYVEYIYNQESTVKLFSVSGGDPAMNGNYINLAIFDEADRGWLVFELDNVRTYKLLKSSKKGYLKIKLTKDTMDNEANIMQRTSTLYINITTAKTGTIQIEEVLN